MQDLGKYHKQINIIYETAHKEPEEAKQMALEKIKYGLAEILTDKYSEVQLNFGMVKVSISGFYFTEDEMKNFINSIALR